MLAHSTCSWASVQSDRHPVVNGCWGQTARATAACCAVLSILNLGFLQAAIMTAPTTRLPFASS